MLDLLNNRTSYKFFDKGYKIPNDDIIKIIEACNMTPTSMGLQLTRTLIIESDEWKNKLFPYSYNQPQIITCSHLVILLTKKCNYEENVEMYLDNYKNIRGENGLEKTKSSINNFFLYREGPIKTWAINQTYITLGNLITYSSSIGIDTCPIEGFNAKEYENKLGNIIEGYEPTVLCALGKGAPINDKSKQKIRIKNSLYNIGII